ncbi:hypothetical protein GALMADRAFT_143114 [Galerina marginata CBS 339.88]|uniref:F-box domain-containing protein n=1 Tax=Galerina marginata (strain CBS 339.88) TaxID=685588 RepID=A0A067SMW2_GALM3|nr:hypothetical protein GALMADRAFT_143114 [Galerina marginata CBS 339.88]
MLDKLLHKLLGGSDHLKNSVPPFRGLKIYRKLKASHTRWTVRGQQAPSSCWHLPLPFDVLFAIVDAYFDDDAVTILSLRQSCHSLAELCRPFLYRTLTIKSRSSDVVTASERLAALLSKSPDIVDHVRTLRVLDHGKMFEGSRPITPEEEYLCYILTRPYPQLKRLELSLHVVWTLLPSQVQHAFEVAFSNVREIAFDNVRIPVNLFRFFTNLRVLEMRGEASIPLIADHGGSTVSTRKPYCFPEWILIKDDTRSGFIINCLFHEQSALRFSNMKHLQLFISGEHIKLLNGRLDMCSGTLTNLELYIGTWGSLPTVLGLESLIALTSLTLTSDISMMPYGSLGTEGLHRFNWLVTTLASSARPSRLESIKFIIRTRSFSFAKQLPWDNLDALFSPVTEKRWPSLRKFDILHIKESKGNMEGSIEAMVLPMMPVLRQSEVLRFRVSSRWMEFWRM